MMSSDFVSPRSCRRPPPAKRRDVVATGTAPLGVFPKPEALPPDVEHVAVVQQPVQHRRGDDGVAEQFAPLAEALVGSEDYAAPLVASRDQGEEGGGRLPVVGPDAELVLERTTRLWNSSRNGEVFLKQECSILPACATPRGRFRTSDSHPTLPVRAPRARHTYSRP